MFVEIILLLTLIVCIFHYYTRYDRIGQLTKNIPGLPDLPVLGSIPYIMGSQKELWALFRKLNNDYYPIFKFWTIREVIINIRHPDDIEILLSSAHHLDKSTVYELLQPWLKTGLLTSAGSKWLIRRKILIPAFHFNVLKKYLDIIIENSEKMVNILEVDVKKDSTKDLLPFTTNYTLHVICEAAMGSSLSEMEEIQKDYRHAIHKMGDILVYRIQRPWLHKESVFKWTKKGREQAESLKILHRFSKKIIHERKEYHNKTNGYYLNQLENDKDFDEKRNAESFGIRKKRLSMLDLLIASSNNKLIDDAGIQEEVDTFIFEGHDTAAMGLCFALLLLGEHKDIQDRARNEVRDILKKSGGKMGYAEINQFHYLEMCIKESLRLYPSVPIISRKLPQDLQLKNYLIPQGAIVHVHIYDLHRDANFWSEPNKFDPDRFQHDKIINRHPFSYIPFSAGPRNCIGQKFAMMELKATIAHLLQNFILESIDLAHEVIIKSDMVIRPAHPLKMKFIPIDV